MTDGDPHAESNRARSDDSSGDPRPTWARLHLWQIQPLRDVAVVLSVVGLIYLGSVVSVVTVPLLLALLLAYLVEPLVQLAERRTPLRRRGAVIVMVLGIGAAVVLPIAGGVAYGVVEAVSFTREVEDSYGKLRASLDDPENERLERRVPDGVWTGIRDAVLWWREREAEADAATEPGTDAVLGGEGEGNSNGEVQVAAAPLDDAPPEPDVGADEPGRVSAADAALQWVEANAGAIARSVFRTGGDALSALAGLIGALSTLGLMLFLTAFFFFFISTGYAKVLEFLRGLVPERKRERVFDLAGKLDRVVSGFVRGRVVIALILGAFFSVGWWAVGVPLAPIVGLATGFLAAFPYAALVGLPVAIVLLALESHDGFRGTWWWAIIGPALIYQIGQLADDYLLTPSIQGKETDLDVPSIMFAVFAGAALFGVYGLLIAIPLAACLKVVVKEVWWPRYRDWVRGDRADVLPLDRA